ncbi:hypothetical protein BH09ACT8_BH09ACT8_56670 [soil metagenome]
MKILLLNPNTSVSMTDEILSAVGVMDIVAGMLGAGTFDFDAVILAGLAAHCASVRACGWGTAEVDADPAAAVDAIVTAAISGKLGIPAIDGVAAAVGLAQAVVSLGLSTSKAGGYAPGPPNPRTNWPLSSALGLDL